MKKIECKENLRDCRGGVGLVNKFVLVSCIELEDNEKTDYEGPVVVLANATDPSFALFFPICPALDQAHA